MGQDPLAPWAFLLCMHPVVWWWNRPTAAEWYVVRWTVDSVQFPLVMFGVTLTSGRYVIKEHVRRVKSFSSSIRQCVLISVGMWYFPGSSLSYAECWVPFHFLSIFITVIPAAIWAASRQPISERHVNKMPGWPPSRLMIVWNIQKAVFGVLASGGTHYLCCLVYLASGLFSVIYDHYTTSV